jgi:ATP-dependent Zn protease
LRAQECPWAISWRVLPATSSERKRWRHFLAQASERPQAAASWAGAHSGCSCWSRDKFRLDQALLRPGRFDLQVILEVHAQGKPLGDDVSLHELARQTVGFSGADLANLLNEAALLAARQWQDAIHQPELDEALLRVMAGPERKSRLITEAEKAVIAHHEVGHAIVMRSIPGSDPVQKVQAIARGMALGVTVQAPAEDRYLMRRSELLARMAGAMGGRAAEEIIFGDITAGASQDIEYVTSLARRMVCELGDESSRPCGPQDGYGRETYAESRNGSED